MIQVLVLVLVQLQILVLDLSGQTWLWYFVGTFFCTGLCPRVAFALLFSFISYKPHFTSATEKVIDITVSMGFVSYVVKREVHVCDIVTSRS